MNTIIRNRPYYKGVTREFESPIHSTKLKYEPGTTVEADGLATDPSEACGQGINFCNTIAGALRFGPVVVEVTVPDGQDIIDAGAKLRAKSVVVGGVVNLTGANLTGANLSRAVLSEANLRRADLSGAVLYQANLRRADLYEADLTGTNLSRADLYEANLYDADLSGAVLYEANLSGANLRRADLSGANLYAANLRRADLSGANLYGANLNEADLNDETTIILPDGWKIENGQIVRDDD